MNIDHWGQRRGIMRSEAANNFNAFDICSQITPPKVVPLSSFNHCRREGPDHQAGTRADAGLQDTVTHSCRGSGSGGPSASPPPRLAPLCFLPRCCLLRKPPSLLPFKVFSITFKLGNSDTKCCFLPSQEPGPDLCLISTDTLSCPGPLLPVAPAALWGSCPSSQGPSPTRQPPSYLSCPPALGVLTSPLGL